MAQLFGQKSEYLIRNDKTHYYSALIIFILLISVTVFFLILSIANHNNLFAIIAIAIIFLLVFGLLRLLAEKNLSISDKFHRGRKGEYEVCDELCKFPDEYFVFQDVKLPGMESNIDFVVIGPTGIYSIEVKSHRGKIKLETEYEKRFLAQAMNEMWKLRDYFKKQTDREYFINPVLVFSRASVRFGLNPVNNVYVIGKNYLSNLILSGKTRLSPEEISILKNVMLKVVK